ncbi:hypothetical protein BSKO_01201 [Bryopsis sp. KO-2023]|nr:hypothetical protein BSKO_01201 [Bryopsis sp. KO-2023]
MRPHLHGALRSPSIPCNLRSRFNSNLAPILTTHRAAASVNRVLQFAVRNSSVGNSGCVRFECQQGTVEFRDESDGKPPQGIFAQLTGAMKGWKLQAHRQTSKLQAFGLAGIAAYGILNTLYYTCAFVLVWGFVVKPQPGLGIAAASTKFVEVMGLVWAGSQVTKLLRLGGALLFAPIVDKALEFIRTKLKLPNKQKAFLAVVLGCMSIALVLFATTLVLWA